MPYQRISADRKQRALYLLLEEGWDKTAISEALGVSEQSIERWEEIYNREGCINTTSHHCGRPRLLTSQMAEELAELISESPSLLLDEIADWLALYHNQPISLTALHDNLRDLGLTYKHLKRAAAERDDAHRSDWLYNITANYTADQLVFLDESSKDDRVVLRRYGRAISGHRAIERTRLSRGIRYSILPALTIEGYAAVRVVEGSVDSAEFFDFVLNDVVSFYRITAIYLFLQNQLPITNPYPGPNSVIILDNCSTHRTEALREIVEESGCLLIFLPAYSPDFNPIEESFSCREIFSFEI